MHPAVPSYCAERRSKARYGHKCVMQLITDTEVIHLMVHQATCLGSFVCLVCLHQCPAGSVHLPQLLPLHHSTTEVHPQSQYPLKESNFTSTLRFGAPQARPVAGQFHYGVASGCAICTAPGASALVTFAYAWSPTMATMICPFTWRSQYMTRGALTTQASHCRTIPQVLLH